MSIEIKVPALPESITEGTIAAWYKKAGDFVKRDEHLVDIETDKVVLEVVAPADGIIEKILKEQGATVNAEEVIGIFNDTAAASDTKGSAAAKQEATIDTNQGRDEHLTPAIRQLIRDQGLDPNAIKGSGKDGRITREDVFNAASKSAAQTSKVPPAPVAQAAQAASQSAQASQPSQTTQAVQPGQAPQTNLAAHAVQPAQAPQTNLAAHAVQPAQAPQINLAAHAAQPAQAPQINLAAHADSSLSGRPEKRVPMTRMRARIAERLLAAKQNTALLTTFNEINLQQVIELRKKYKDTFEKTYGVRLGFMSFFTMAVVEALKKFPIINAFIDGNDIVYHDYYDIGIAVSSPRGLVVPILRNADTMGMAEIEKKIEEYGQKAKTGQLSMEEITGGTFTISNGGVFGSLMSTPILNPPQSAILGMHKILERPIAEEGQVVIRPMMYVALTYDHRIIDGVDSVRFLVTIKELLEEPARMALGI